MNIGQESAQHIIKIENEYDNLNSLKALKALKLLPKHNTI